MASHLKDDDDDDEEEEDLRGAPPATPTLELAKAGGGEFSNLLSSRVLMSSTAVACRSF